MSTVETSAGNIRKYHGGFVCKLKYWMSDQPGTCFDTHLYGGSKEEVQKKIDDFIAQIKKV